MDHYGIDEHFKQYPRLTLTCHKSNVHSVKWSPDGYILASGGKDTVLRLHRITESELALEQKYSNSGHTDYIDQLCWNPVNSNLLATASIDKHTKIWNVNEPDPVISIRFKHENMTVCWSNDGSTIAVADKGDVVSFIDTRESFKIMKEQKFQFEVTEITWNKENDLFFVTSGNGKIHVLSYPNLQTLLVIDAFATPCICIRFDPTGRYFAVGSMDAIASIWDSENFACIQAVARQEWPIKTVSFSYDSRYLASGSEDSYIDVVDIHTGQQVSAINVQGPTMTLDFHPKEYILAYASDTKEHREHGAIKLVGYPERRQRAHNNYMT